MSGTSPTPARLRVLLITRNLPPLRGGMERLNHHMALQMAQEFDVAVIGPTGCRQLLPQDIEVHEVSVARLWRFFCGTLWTGIHVSRTFMPDIVLAGSGLAAPFAWLAARLAGARFAVYVHGLDLIAHHPVYRWFWRPFIRRADLCIANSRNTVHLAMAIGVPEERLRVIHPGVEMPATVPDDGQFSDRFDLGGRPLLLSVGRLIARKGLLEFVERALPGIVAEVPDVCLVVLGEEEPNLLHGSSAGLGARIRVRARSLGLERNLRFVGTQDDSVLSAAYSAADVHVFPVREVEHDVEGFGMVAVEAAAHGLPTAAFAVGGVPDAVGDGVSGCLVPPGDYGRLCSKIIEMIRSGKKADQRLRMRAFAEQFSWPHFGENIRRELRRLARAEART